jgi:hypothetical protein
MPSEIYETPLKALRRQIIERIQKQSRDARLQSEADVQEGGVAEPVEPPQQTAALGNPLELPAEQESEYMEGEA